MNRRGVLHATAAVRLTPQFFPSTIAIEAATVEQDETGFETRVWATVDGLEAIPAAIAPFNTQNGAEVRRPDGTLVVDAWRIALGGHYPAITPGNRIMADDGRGWDIVGVEHDSHGQLTRLKAELVT